MHLEAPHHPSERDRTEACVCEGVRVWEPPRGVHNDDEMEMEMEGDHPATGCWNSLAGGRLLLKRGKPGPLLPPPFPPTPAAARPLLQYNNTATGPRQGTDDTAAYIHS